MRVDVRTLVLPGSNQDWVEECRQSCRKLPVNHIVINGVRGHLGQSRAAAYQLGRAELLSFVDYDDYLLPGFTALIDSMNGNPDLAAVYGDKLIIQGNITQLSKGSHWSLEAQMRLPRLVHQPVIYRREAVMHYLSELLNWPNLCDRVLAALVTRWGRLKYVPALGYAWRKHDSQNSLGHSYDEINAARKFTNKVLRC